MSKKGRIRIIFIIFNYCYKNILYITIIYYWIDIQNRWLDINKEHTDWNIDQQNYKLVVENQWTNWEILHKFYILSKIINKILSNKTSVNTSMLKLMSYFCIFSLYLVERILFNHWIFHYSWRWNIVNCADQLLKHVKISLSKFHTTYYAWNTKSVWRYFINMAFEEKRYWQFKSANGYLIN